MINKIYLSGLVLVAVSVLSAKSYLGQGNPKFSEKHLIIVLRNIGHQLLLKAGDSTSVVLPVQKVNEETFQIKFQSEFVFAHDTLVSLVEKNFKSANILNGYIVSVLNCESNALVFGYEINAQTNSIIPCTGRKQAIGCYIIQVELLQELSPNFTLFFLLLIPLAFAGYFSWKKYFEKQKPVQLINGDAEFIPLGNYSFFEQKQVLKYNREITELSDKESKLLKIFVDNLDQLVAREQLLKEIWEDEGTIVVGRSLDVLVSKLRKKLLKDDNIKIFNVHGKGYRMIVRY